MHFRGLLDVDIRELTNEIPPREMDTHAPSHMLKPTLASVDYSKFYIIAVCSNPVRFRSRYRLFNAFKKHLLDQGIKVITVEVAYGDRHFMLTNPNNPYDLQLRTRDELWHKENMVNLGVQYLTKHIDPDWKYVGWVDGDIKFARSDIGFETVHQLQHHMVVQMFSHCQDLGPNYEPLALHVGFMKQYWDNAHKAPVGAGYSRKWYGGYGYGFKPGGIGFWHPGYAWAARREFFDKIGLMERAALGAGDHHMALALIGQAERSLPRKVTKTYKDMVLDWQNVTERLVRRNVGFVPGLITHNWHGKKSDRKYVDRWDVLINNKFNPYSDLTTDAQGLLRLAEHDDPRHMALRDDIYRYFRQRHEDSIDVE